MDEEKKKEGFIKRTVERAKETGKKIVNTAEIVYEAAMENKEVAAVLATAVFTIGGTIGKAAVKSYDRKARRDDKARDLYDPHTRQHHYLRRPMTQDQKREFNYRIKRYDETGETYFDILTDMGVDFY